MKEVAREGERDKEGERKRVAESEGQRVFPNFEIPEIFGLPPAPPFPLPLFPLPPRRGKRGKYQSLTTRQRSRKNTKTKVSPNFKILAPSPPLLDREEGETPEPRNSENGLGRTHKIPVFPNLRLWSPLHSLPPTTLPPPLPPSHLGGGCRASCVAASNQKKKSAYTRIPRHASTLGKRSQKNIKNTSFSEFQRESPGKRKSKRKRARAREAEREEKRRD